MPNIKSFVRSTPSELVIAILQTAGIDPPAVPKTKSALAKWRKKVHDVVEACAGAGRVQLEDALERIEHMSDEAGDAAILGLTIHQETLDELPSAHARAAWLFLNDAPAFRCAEDIRYTDEHRLGRLWSPFASTKARKIPRDNVSIDAFASRLKEHFSSANIKVEIFDRTRPSFAGDDRELVQATIYREGRQKLELAFQDGELEAVPRRPVYEAAVTYEPSTGAIEVVAKDVLIRRPIAELFCQILLQMDLAEPLSAREYRLQGLAKRTSFPSDPGDRIESVRVTELRLRPFDTQAERVTLESKRGAHGDIWSMAALRMRDPLDTGWQITRAKLSIRFHPSGDSRRKRVLPVTITIPHGCDLKERTERERLIGGKYLKRWGLLAAEP